MKRGQFLRSLVVAVVAPQVVAKAAKASAPQVWHWSRIKGDYAWFMYDENGKPCPIELKRLECGKIVAIKLDPQKAKVNE